MSQPELLSIPAFIHDDLQALELDDRVDQSVLQQLALYLTLLLKANEQFNLTAIRDPEQAWRRMIVDSLTILPGFDHLGKGARIIDVGTGGGLPGMPLAISRPDLSVTLLDATAKKCRFLQETADALGLTHVEVIQARAEDYGSHSKGAGREQFDVVVSRAVGPMRILLEWCTPLAKVDGRVLAMKGPKAQEELHESQRALDQLGIGDLAVIEAYPPEYDLDLVIVSMIKARPTPKSLPRVPGLAKRDPL